MQKIIVNSQTLLKALTYANKVIERNPVVPILENFLFEVTSNRLTVSGSDLQNTFKLSLQINTPELETDFKACVPAEIMKYLAKLDGLILIAFDNECFSIEILTEDGIAKYSGENAIDFPNTKQTNFHFLDTTSSLFTEFKDLLNFVSKDELRPAMTGIYFGTHKGNFNLCATNGHTLKKVTIPELSEQSENSKQHFILSGKAAKILSDLKFGTTKKPEHGYVKIKVLDIEREYLEDTEQPVESTPVIDRTNISFHFILDSFEVEFITRNIDERFPDYENVIPTQEQTKTKFTISKKEITKQIDKAMLFANKTTHQVRIKLNGVNQISAEDLDFSNEYCANLNGTYEGEPIEIGFNAKFLNECIESCPGENVTLDLIAPNKAGVFRTENSMVLLMPVMLNQYV